MRCIEKKNLGLDLFFLDDRVYKSRSWTSIELGEGHGGMQMEVGTVMLMRASKEGQS